MRPLRLCLSFFSSRRRHTRFDCDWSSDVCSSDLELDEYAAVGASFVGRRWRTLASLRLAAEVERTSYAAIPDTALASLCPACATRNLVGGSATLTPSHLVLGALSGAPEQGCSWVLTY